MQQTSTSDMTSMDSLKIPKVSSASSGGSKSPGTQSITVRFNAGEECIDDILQSFHKNSGNSGGGDSLSSSPSQPQHSSDDANTRNNFLQGNFFTRKRSGSIERISPTATGPNLITALAGTTDTASVGTWKLIKGKVSQTIEDIKLSKNNIQATTSTANANVIPKSETQNEPDSDQETATGTNTSISEELPLDQQDIKQQQQQQQQQTQQRRGSDSDFETEIFLEADIELSRLRRGLDKLKNKVKAKSTAHQPLAASSLTAAINTSNSAARALIRESSPIHSATSSAGVSQRSKFLRKRSTQPTVEAVELATTTMSDFAIPVASSKSVKPKKGIVAGSKDIEIESGVEMLEDTLPTPAKTVGVSEIAEGTRQTQRQHLGLPLLADQNLQEFQDVSDKDKPLSWDKFRLENEPSAKTLSLQSESSIGTIFLSVLESSSLDLLKTSIQYMPVVLILAFLLVLILPIPDFIRGVLACLLSVLFLDSAWSATRRTIEKYLCTNPPEKTEFKIPDYSKVPICEIPAVEEHKTVKAYSGWMGEINNYDPSVFHISMTKSVYVKLEGTILRLSTTTAHIPKRAMWNDVPIDRKTLVFTNHRTYNLLGCRVEMLPRGMARKRYFNRKYPIQLIVKNCTQPENTPHKPEAAVSNFSAIYSSTKDDTDLTLRQKDIRSSANLATLTSSNQQSTNDLTDSTTERTVDSELETDFSTTILNANLRPLLDVINPDEDLKTLAVPCGDEVRLLLFSRGDREKEDWYRRFVAASTGEVFEQDLRLPNIKLVDDWDLQAAAAKAAVLLTANHYKQREAGSQPDASPQQPATSGSTESTNNMEHTIPFIAETGKTEKRGSTKQETPDRELYEDCDEDMEIVEPTVDETFQGLLISSCAARNPVDYLRFMALYQRACSQPIIPVIRKVETGTQDSKTRRRHRRAVRQKDELWKGIDQSLFLGPSGSVVWANVLIGRVLFSCLNDSVILTKVHEFLQKKLSSVRLPSFMEDVVITEINPGDKPPLIHRVSQPMLDERGTWIDADVTYEGLLQITVTTKLNLLRMKRPTRPVDPLVNIVPPVQIIADDDAISHSQSLPEDQLRDALSGSTSAIYDSDAESSGGSSSESESNVASGGTGEATNATTNEFNVFQNSPGNARRIFKIVDRFTASNFFQYATELSYVQRAMENMSANITLRVDIRGLVSRATINIPPPPSDRVWLAFRGPPRLWISAKPAVGDKSFDWSIVTNVIESKLCDEVNKYLVYPNMVDITIPFLGQSTYQE